MTERFFVWAGSGTRREWPKMLKTFCGKEQEHKDIIITFERYTYTEQADSNTQQYNTEHMQYKQ